VQSNYYWSSSSSAYDTSYAWIVYVWGGNVLYDFKALVYYVWPVRSGQ